MSFFQNLFLKKKNLTITNRLLLTDLVDKKNDNLSTNFTHHFEFVFRFNLSIDLYIRNRSYKLENIEKLTYY